VSPITYGFGDALAADIGPVPPPLRAPPSFLETAFQPDSPLVKLLVQQFQSASKPLYSPGL